ncbi:peptidoglycan-binding domain-containing protein [Nonomuraea salmonea]|uniref:peptidoglycan-binding domain-containing protein n=1 Tax=Nonomuraea salmonea TaxID=46181 RepID=UPI002FE8832A
MTGKDVESLERNLDKLGYDGFTVDDEFTWDTAQAVMEWQDDRGLPETGVVELGRVVFAPPARCAWRACRPRRAGRRSRGSRCSRTRAPRR